MKRILVSIDGEEWFELPDHSDEDYRYIVIDEDISDEQYELFIQELRERQ